MILGVEALLWEFLCPKDEMLSHGFDTFLQHHKIFTWTATVVTVAHLLNVPERLGRVGILDPYRAVGLVREKSG